jgi:rhodanese-related sulfurtransferase
MDTLPLCISVLDLYRQLGSTDSPLVIDVRREAAFAADNTMIASATWRDPLAVNDWEKYLPRHRPIVVYCVHGYEVSSNTCSALRSAGLSARTLEGGIAAWKQAALPLTTKMPDPVIPSAINRPSKWITRERPKIDRIACPWLIRRFIDPFAEFIYVPANHVLQEAVERKAIPYDIPSVRFSHRNERCSFDTLLEDFAINDDSLASLAAIVRGADTGKPELTPQSAGLLAISLGLSTRYTDDHVMLEYGMIIYDALYAWLKSARKEVHNADLFKQS